MSDANLTLDTGNAGSSLSTLSSTGTNGLGAGGGIPAMRERMTGFLRDRKSVV